MPVENRSASSLCKLRRGASTAPSTAAEFARKSAKVGRMAGTGGGVVVAAGVVVGAGVVVVAAGGQLSTRIGISSMVISRSASSCTHARRLPTA